MSALRLFARTAVRTATRPVAQRFMASSVLAARGPVRMPIRIAPALGVQTRSYGLVVPLPTQVEAEERVMKVLGDFEKTDQSKLTLDAHYIKDLGLDSLDVVEVVMHVEEEFDCEIPDHDAETLFTAKETAEYIYKHLQEFKA